MNQQQKPVDITGKSITCRLLSYNGAQVLLQKALNLSLALNGIATLDLNPADIENIPAQKCYYTLEIPSGEFSYPVFVDQNAGGRGDLNLVDSILPSFIPSSEVTIPTGQTFPNISNSSGNTELVYFSSVINTEESPILTIQAKLDEYYGNITVLGSCQPDSDWYTVIDREYDDVSETDSFVVQGYHPFVKLQFTSNAGAVTNILSR